MVGERRKLYDILMTDAEFMELLKEDTQKAMEWLMGNYIVLVYTIVYSKVSDVCSKEDVEECVSDIFYIFHKHRDSIDLSKGNVKSFLVVIAKRTAINRFHSAIAKRNKINKDAVCVEEVIDTLYCDIDLEQTIIESEARSEIYKAINNLKEPNREIMIHKFFYLETSKQIGERLQLSVNAVDKRVSKCISKLKLVLGGYFNG